MATKFYGVYSVMAARETVNLSVRVRVPLITPFEEVNLIAVLNKSRRGNMKKLTVKQHIKELQKQVADQCDVIIKLRAQMNDQNNLLDRARTEGNQLIDKYNKLAGKVNAMRTLVNSND